MLTTIHFYHELSAAIRNYCQEPSTTQFKRVIRQIGYGSCHVSLSLSSSHHILLENDQTDEHSPKVWVGLKQKGRQVTN